MTGVVEVSLTTNNFKRVHGKINRFPKEADLRIRQKMSDYFEKDFKPLLNRVMKGFKLAGVPAINVGRWVGIKQSMLGVSHSLGIHNGYPGRPASRMHPQAMAVKAKIHTGRDNRTTLKADYSNIPEGAVPYLKIIHEKGMGNQRQDYPFVDATVKATEKKFLRRVSQGVSDTWNST